MNKDKALDLALETLESIQVVYPCETVGKRIAAIKQARSAPTVQEPVAWRYDLKQTGSFAGVSTEYSPVKLSIGENWTPLYTTPPAAQRQWVGLTDEERYELLDKAYNPESYAVLIEAKLKEKNYV